MKPFAKQSQTRKVTAAASKVLPPDTMPPLQSLIDLIEGYIKAQQDLKGAFDTSCIRYLCQQHTLPAEAYTKLTQLQAAVNAMKADVDGCIGLYNS